MKQREPTPRPAATVALVRDAECGLEVLLLQRNLESGFMPGMQVFPGGALDEADRSPEAHAMCTGIDDASASRALRIERGGLAYWIAAIRETFEEAGILLAYDARGGIVMLNGTAARRFHAHRIALENSHKAFCAMALSEGLKLAADRMLYFSHWITPVGAPRRYDTRFFLAIAPEGQRAAHDRRETIAHVWLRPAEALDRYRRGELKMRFPTVRTLEQFAQHASADSLISALSARREVPALLPRLSREGRSLLPGDPGYDEAGDAAERGHWKI